MSQPINDVNIIAAPSAAKPAWVPPVIESYDVAEFTLAINGSNGTDGGGANIS